MRLSIITFFGIFCSLIMYGQNITITDDSLYTAHSSAVLDVKSNTMGFLVPRLTSTQINNINEPATGLLVFQSDEPQGFLYNDGTTTSPNWIALSTSSTTLWLKGPIGTTTLLSNVTDSVGIGTIFPEEKLDVNGNLILDNFHPLILFKEDSLDAGQIQHIGAPIDGYLHLQAWDGNNFEATGLVIKATSQNVGIGTITPAYKLDVIGTSQMNGFILAMPTDSGYVLTSDANGVGTWQLPASHIAGAGSPNYVPVFTNTDTLSSSVIYQDSTGKIGINTNLPDNLLSANGMIESMSDGFMFPDGTVQTTAALSSPGGSSDSISFGGPPTAADGRWFIGMEMQSIPGSWDTIECMECSKIFDLDWQIYLPRDGGTGLITGVRTHTILTIYKNIDKASVFLIQKLVNQSSIDEIKFKFFRYNTITSGYELYYIITLENAIVVDFHHKAYHAGNKVMAHMDQVSFMYQSIVWEWLEDGVMFEDDWLFPPP